MHFAPQASHLGPEACVGARFGDDFGHRFRDHCCAVPGSGSGPAPSDPRGRDLGSGRDCDHDSGPFQSFDLRSSSASESHLDRRGPATKSGGARRSLAVLGCFHGPDRDSVGSVHCLGPRKRRTPPSAVGPRTPSPSSWPGLAPLRSYMPHGPRSPGNSGCEAGRSRGSSSGSARV